MNPRIPRPVNTVLDAAHRHPRAVIAVVAGAAVAWSVALYWASPIAAVITAAVLAVYVVVMVFTVREMRLREMVRQRDYDLAAANQIIKRATAGDPTAPTTQLRPIGDRGEPL